MTLNPAARYGQRMLPVAAVAAAVSLLSFPSAAGAHAALLTTTPRWGAVLPAAPHALTLMYDENVVARYARVSVLTPRGQNLAGAPRVSGRFVTVPLRPGGKGSYAVRWRMVASNDGHVTEGAYSFGVRTKPLAPAALPGLGVPVAPEALSWLEFLGVVLAGGTLTFRALVWAPAARVLGEDGAGDAPAVLWASILGAVVALHAGLFGFLVGAYPIVGGGLSTFVDTQIVPIRTATHFGQAFTFMTFAWLAVLALLVGAWVTPRRRERLLMFAGLLSLAIAFGISWASHADGQGPLALTADYLHLLAAALWVGGLVALAILVGVVRPLPRTQLEPLARACVLRFSRLAVPTVALLAVAGAYLALRTLPSASALFTSNYGLTLMLKSVVAFDALAIGGYHHRLLVPKIAEGAPVASMRRTLVLELGLLLVALVLAASLSQTAPPT